MSWVEDRDSAWVPAEVADFKPKQVQLVVTSGKKVLASPEKVFLRDGEVDDMTKLTHLNEPGVLYNLRRRYALNDIYIRVMLWQLHSMLYKHHTLGDLMLLTKAADSKSKQPIPVERSVPTVLILAGIMATVSQADSRRMYSWWWDSHISPKNSRWLKENLTGMKEVERVAAKTAYMKEKVMFL